MFFRVENSQLLYFVMPSSDSFQAYLGNETSALTDSFQDNLLAPPIYTRPADYNGHKVPDILTSGNTPKVEQWREEQAVERTKKLRPDLL